MTRYAGLDVLLTGVAVLVPALSHVTGVPLYRLNPMLALLLAGVLVSKDWRNGLLLAVLMPLVSCLVVGMPAAPKMVCMMAELATVATLFGWLSRRWSVLPAVLTAAVAAKAVYYGLKWLLVGGESLVGTAWWLQLGAVVVWCGVFAMLYKKGK